MKKILCIILVIALLFSCTACVDGDKQGTDPENTSSQSGKEEFSYVAEDFFKNIGKNFHVKYQYSFYASVEKSQGYVVEVTRKNDELTYDMEGVQIVYKKEGDKFYQYLKIDENNLTKMSDEGMTQEEFESMANDYISLATYYDTIDTSEFKKKGTATVAGRNCEIYEASRSYLATTYFEQLYIDVKTGACLKVKIDFGAGGEKSGTEFEALIFEVNK